MKSKKLYEETILNYGNEADKTNEDIIKPTFFETNFFPLEKKTGPVGIEPRTFGVSGLFVTSKLGVPETLDNLNSL